jgi:hypothetical protein
MVLEAFHPVMAAHLCHIRLQTTLVFLAVFFCALTISTSAQETSGFKPVNGVNDPKPSGAGDKPTEFITYKNRNLLQTTSSNDNESSAQPYLDYYTRGLPNYPPNNAGGSPVQTNSLAGLFPSNFGPFNQPSGQLPFQNSIPFPSFPFQGLGAGFPPGAGGPIPGDGFGKPPGQFPGQGASTAAAFPPQFPFNRPHNPNPTGIPIPGGYYPPSHGTFPGHEYPQYNHVSNTNNNGIANLYLGLPRQVKVPGRIEISLNGNNAEIICEFPRFFILIQVIYKVLSNNHDTFRHNERQSYNAASPLSRKSTGTTATNHTEPTTTPTTVLVPG